MMKKAISISLFLLLAFVGDQPRAQMLQAIVGQQGTSATFTPVFNNVGTMVDEHTGNTFSSAFSVTAGSNICAFAEVLFDGATGLSLTSVTYGGNAMTSAGTPAFNSTSNLYSAIYYLGNPPTGSNTLAVTGSASVAEIYMNLISFKNSNTSACVRPGTYNTATGSGTSASLTISSNSSDLTISAIESVNTISSSNQTNDSGTIDLNGNYDGASARSTTGASSVTHTWTLSSGAWALAGVSVQ